jgi:hypothetical protein
MASLSEQLSLRLPPTLRQFIQDELEEVRSIDPRLKASEADIVRAHLEAARKRKQQTKKKAGDGSK